MEKRGEGPEWCLDIVSFFLLLFFFPFMVRYRVENSKVMVCRVCGFRVHGCMEVLQNLTEHLGYGYWGLTELTEVPGTGMRMLYPYPGYCRAGRKMLYPYPGCCRAGMEMLCPYPEYCGRGVHNSQKFRVLYGYEHVVPVPRILPDRNENVVPVPWVLPGGYENVVSVLRLLWHGRTDFTEVPGTGINICFSCSFQVLGIVTYRIAPHRIVFTFFSRRNRGRNSILVLFSTPV